MKHFPNTSHDFTQICIILCLDKLVGRVKHFPQTSQEYGFSPEYVILCVDRSGDYDFTPV